MLRVSIDINEDLMLRQLDEEDAKDLFALASRNRVHIGRYLPWVHETHQVQDSLNFIQSVKYTKLFDPQFPLKILYKNEFIGMCGFNRGNESLKQVEIGYWLDEKYNGQGIMTTCVQAQIAYLKTRPDVDLVKIMCNLDNYKSAAVPQRLGFVYRGIIDDKHFYQYVLK